ncbi:MAG: bifunctional diaminohydroxyphosphoribosylaminopyrimidine deaminase/5-amino-6-(5-phosphoribosylamino)uracil reductase RibD [Planctomycetota bacterium]
MPVSAEFFMRRALELALQGIPAAFPNPVVGCVIEKDGEVFGEGAHLQFGGPHAEVIALAAAGDRAKGATAWVTLEPCSHHGKTPPCTDALIKAGVRQVVYSATDPNPRTSGKARALLEAAGIAVDNGLLELLAKRQNAPFFKVHTLGLPWVTAKWAMTLDGKIATSSGHSKWITGDSARTRARRFRGEHGCVLVGIGTVLADDPSLAGPDGVRPPKRAVADASARIPMECQIVKGAREIETFIGVSKTAPEANVRRLEAAGCRVIPLDATIDGIDLTAFLRAIAPHATSVFAEGGSHILGSLFDAGLVDEVCAFIAPSVLGGALAPAPVGGLGKKGPALAERLFEVRTEPIGDDLLMRGLVRNGYGGVIAGLTRIAPSSA